MKISDIIYNRIKEADGSYAASDNISKFIKAGEMYTLQCELTDAFEQVLNALVIDTSDPNSKDTPSRLAKMYLYEIMAGRYEPMPKVTAFPNTGETKYDGMLVVRAELTSLCAHHHQTISGVAYIGIIPNGSVLGLSKYIRLAQWCAKRGTLQEQLTVDIWGLIQAETGTHDVGVYIIARHGCCENRGIEAHNSVTQTTKISGKFKEPEVREEFFNQIKIAQQSRTMDM